MIASSRTALISCGMISGVGLAKAKIIGFSAIFATISPETNPPFERPNSTSAPTKAAARSPFFLSTANGALNSFNSPASKRFFVIIPLESHITIFPIFTPKAT